VAATDKAAEIGNSKLFNMIVLGGFISIKPIVNPEFIEKGLRKSLPERHHGLIPANLKAVEIGKEIVKPVNVL
jgi:2-oxoglutarate ferredoxin oxidoreductase subunit gamma